MLRFRTQLVVHARRVVLSNLCTYSSQRLFTPIGMSGLNLRLFSTVEPEHLMQSLLNTTPSEMMIDEMLTMMISEDVPVFPEYMHDELRQRCLDHFKLLDMKKNISADPKHGALATMEDMQDASVSQEEALFTFASRAGAELAKTDDDMLTILSPTTPRLGNMVRLPMLPQEGKVIKRWLRKSAAHRGHIDLMLELQFDSKEVTELSFPLENSEDIRDILKIRDMVKRV